MEPNQAQTSERERYINNLESKLRKAGKARRFQDSEDGSIVTEYLTDQINSIIKEIGGTKYLDDFNGYQYKIGQLHMAQKLLNMLNNESNTEVKEIRERLDSARADT